LTAPQAGTPGGICPQLQASTTLLDPLIDEYSSRRTSLVAAAPRRQALNLNQTTRCSVDRIAV